MVLAMDEQAEGEHAAAIHNYENVLAQTGDGDSSVRAVALNNLAWLYYMQSDPRAVDTARKASALAPDQPTIADTYGWLLLQKQALPLLKSAAGQAPDSPQIRYHYAAALARSGEKAEARLVLQDVLLDPQSFDGRKDAERLLASL